MAELSKDIEGRLLALEKRVAFVAGGVTVGAAAILAFLGITTWFQIPNAVNNEIEALVGTEARTQISEALSVAEALNESKSGIWPSGQYCILKNGQCPNGFDEYRGFLKGIQMARGTDGVLKPVSFGNSALRRDKDQEANGTDARKPGPHGEIVIAACCTTVTTR